MDNYSDMTKLEKEAARRAKALKLLYKKPIAEVAKEFGVTRQTINNWRKQKNREGHLKPQKLGGSERKTFLIPEEEIKQIIQTHTPINLGYKSNLWNIAVVKEMICDNYGTKISSYKMKQLLDLWGLYPKKKHGPWWTKYASRNTDNIASSTYACKTKSQLYLIDFIRNEDRKGGCFYAITPNNRVHFLYADSNSKSYERIPIDVDFLISLQRNARRKIIVIYSQTLTAEHLKGWRRTEDASKIKLI